MTSFESPSRRDLSGGTPLSQRLKEMYGANLEPTLSLEDEPKPDSAPSSKLFERLRSQAPRGIRYELLGEIARGGMGAILKIWDDELRRTLAMKIVLDREGTPPGAAPFVDPKLLERFLEEAQVTGQLDHPGIVPVHELGLGTEGRVYFTMRLVKGEDLSKIFQHVNRSEEGWTQLRALNVMLKVCEAMSYAHSKLVIHRDLKPSNVMVGKFGEVYVMDWGLARVLGREDKHDLRIQHAPSSSVSAIETDRRSVRDDEPESPLITMDGDVVGTPSFMPPEQARGQLERLGPRSDVYSIGAMIYALIAGEMPYVPRDARVSARTILSSVLNGPPKSLFELAPHTPAELIAIVDRAMARELEARYPSMQELAEDLRAFIEGRVVRAYETGTWAETKKWMKRNKALALAVAAAGVIAVLGAGAVAVKGEQAKQEAARRIAADEQLRIRAAADRELELSRQLFDLRGTLHLIDRGERKEADKDRRRLVETLQAAGWDFTRPTPPEDQTSRLAALAVQSPALHRAVVDALIDLALQDPPSEQEAARLGEHVLLSEQHPLILELWRARDGGAQAVQGIIDGVVVEGVSSNDSAAVLCTASQVAGATLPKANLIALLRRAVQAGPGEFWPRYFLADALFTSDPGGAALHLEAAVAVEPRASFAQRALGRLYAKKGQHAEAARCYQAALQNQPDSRWTRIALSESLSDQGRHQEALAEIDLALAREPNSAVLFQKRGALHVLAGNEADALRDLESSIAIDPTYSYAYMTRGFLHHRRRRLAEAKADLERAIELDPSYAYSHSKLAEVHQNLGDLPRAIQCIDAALKLSPNAPAILSLQCWLRSLNGDYDIAIGAGRRAVVLMPNDATVMINLANAFLGAGQDGEALKIYDRWITRDPDHEWARCNRGWILHNAQRYREARVDFERTLELSSTNESAHHGLAHCLQGLGSPRAAQEHVAAALTTARAVERDSTANAIRVCELACLLRQSRDLEGAAIAFERASRIDGMRIQSRMMHADVLRDLGRHQEALDVFDKLITDHPNDEPEAHCNRTWRLVAVGRLEDALESMRRGHELGSVREAWTYPSDAWISEIECFARSTDLLDGVRQPASTLDWAILSRWHMRSGRTKPGLESFERIAAALESDEATLSTAQSLGVYPWMLYELPALNAAVAMAGSTDGAERERLARVALAWVSRQLAIEKADALSPSPRRPMAWHVANLSMSLHWSTATAVLLNAGSREPWGEVAKHLRVEIEVLRALEREF